MNFSFFQGEGKISEEQVVPNDSLQVLYLGGFFHCQCLSPFHIVCCLTNVLIQEKLDLGLSPKGIRSKRTARGGAGAIGDDNVKNGDGLKQVLKQGQSESTEGETESGSTRRRRKPNSLLNPEEGYSFKTSSSIKKVHEKELGAAKKASLPTKVGQTNQSVVISLSPSSKARKGSRKRSRSKMEETDLDAGSVATPASKKQIVKKDEPEEKEDLMETSLEKPKDSTKTAKSSKKEKAQKGSASKKQIMKKDDAEEEEDFMETDLEKPEESTKTAKSSKKEREEKGSTKSTAKKPLAESKKEKAQKGSAKTAAKKPPAESKKEIGENGLAKTSAKKPLEKSVHSDAKKKNSEGASMESSKSKVVDLMNH